MRATPANGLTGQIAVSLYSLALVDLQGGPPRFIAPHPPTYSRFSWAPDGSKIVYTLMADLWVVDVTTHQIWNLTYAGWYRRPDRWELMPNWSPDGRRIAFTSRPIEPEEQGQTEVTMHGVFGGQLTIIEADGSGYRVLDEDTVVSIPSWAPDARRLAYTTQDGSLYIFDLTTGQKQPVILADYGIEEALCVSDVAWSPSGDELAFSFSTRSQLEGSLMEAGCAILNLKDYTHKMLKRYTVKLSYKGTSLGEPPGCSGPDIKWNPSGKLLLVNVVPLSRMNMETGLFVINVEDGDEVNLRGEYGAYAADWSPDGDWVVYVDGGDRSLWVVNALRPKERYQVMGMFCCEGDVAWRPGSSGP